MSLVLREAAAVDSVLDVVGHTPLVRLRRLPDPAGADVFVKLEGFNPSGSVKDRSALGMIDAAEAAGSLAPGMTVIESSSGNLGVAIAQIGAVRGYRVIIVADRKASPAQVALMTAYGAEVDLVQGDPPEGLQQARWHRVRELAAIHAPAFIPDQYDNPDNPAAHARTTGAELLAALGDRFSTVVATVSTGGHLSGIAECVRPMGVRIVAVDIAGSALFRSESHPYLTNGMGLSWTPGNLADDLIDTVVVADDITAFETARALALHEGILAGPSTGAAVAAAIGVASTAAPEDSVVAIAPDRGDRYVDSLLQPDWCERHGIRAWPSVRQVRENPRLASLGRSVRRTPVGRDTG
ncbi:MAG: cysteine synthase family protein [Actinomycetota bacterium]